MGLELAKMWVRVRADDTGMQQDLAKTKTRLAATGAALSAVAMGTATGAIALGAALGIGAAGSRGIGLAADLETTTIAFETMLGSATAAKKMLADLTQFAAATPFELPQIQQATKILLAFGVTQDKILPTLRTLGDISAGTGKDFGDLAVIFGQVKAKGRLMGGELLQFSEAGVPMVAQLAKQFKVAESQIAKMSEQGRIKFADVEKALTAMSSEGGLFFDLMKRQSTTVMGLWSTLKDSVDGHLRGLFHALEPITRAALQLGITLSESFGGFVESVRANLPLVTAAFYDTVMDMKSTWNTEWALMVNSFATHLAKMVALLKNWVDLIQKGIMTAADTLYNPWKAVSQGFDMNNVPQMDMSVVNALKEEREAIIRAHQQEINRFRGMPFGLGVGPLGNTVPVIPQQAQAANSVDDTRGRIGFAELGRKMQDALMKKTDDNQLKMIGLLEAGNAKQDELIKAVKDKPVAQMGLQ